MNKFLKVALSVSFAAVMALGTTACGEKVKSGSKITDCTVSFDVGGDTTTDVKFELYDNFAPGTIEHFVYLAKKGYYDGTVVSNVGGYVEFGEFYGENGDYKSKYEKDVDKGYYDFITESYVKGKTIGSSGKRQRYLGEYYNVAGEFSANGINGNKLDLINALVLKREKGDSESEINSAKATMAVTFGSTSYYSAAGQFAVLGKIVSGADAVKKMMTDYQKDEDGNVYYYYAKDSEVNTLGRYFMKNSDGETFAKGESGYTVAVSAESNKEIFDELNDNKDYLINVPYRTIKIAKITF